MAPAIVHVQSRSAILLGEMFYLDIILEISQNLYRIIPGLQWRRRSFLEVWAPENMVLLDQNVALALTQSRAASSPLRILSSVKGVGMGTGWHGEKILQTQELI